MYDQTNVLISEYVQGVQGPGRGSERRHSQWTFGIVKGDMVSVVIWDAECMRSEMKTEVAKPRTLVKITP